MTCFFPKVTLFLFQKKRGKKNLCFLWSIKQSKNFCLKIMNASLRRKKNVKSLFLLKTLTWARYGYRYSSYEPGFYQSVLKIFVIITDSLFAKYGKLTTRYLYKSIKQNILNFLTLFTLLPKQFVMWFDVSILIKVPTSNAINRRVHATTRLYERL